MRTFVILALVAVAYARPDVSLGYKYEQAGSHHAHTPGLAPPLSSGSLGSSSHNIPTFSAGGPSLSHGNGHSPIQYATSSVQHTAAPIQHIAAPTQHYATQPQHAAAPAQHVAAPVQHVAAPTQHFSAPVQNIAAPTQHITFPAQHNAAPAQHNAAPAQQFQQTSFPTHIADEAPRHQAPIITKQFYLHSAPEDHDSIGKTKHFVLGRAQKNYRVVFIKSPSSSNANVHLSAEYAPQEEKTVIYVLSQKEHELDVNDIATPAPTQPSKPEVFFIKYKTPEEAAHAQHEIQRQYDVLGGQSQVSDEGAAPVSSVIGSLGQGEQPSASSNHGTAAYLPPHY